jgi:beta-glucosidase
MKHLLFAVFTAVSIVSQVDSRGASADDKYVETLLRSMSLDEKIGQMTQIDLGILAETNYPPIRMKEAELREALVTYKVGSLFNNGVTHALSLEEWRSLNKTFQDIIRQETPHKINRRQP